MEKFIRVHGRRFHLVRCAISELAGRNAHGLIFPPTGAGTGSTHVGRSVVLLQHRATPKEVVTSWNLKLRSWSASWVLLLNAFGVT